MTLKISKKNNEIKNKKYHNVGIQKSNRKIVKNEKRQYRYHLHRNNCSLSRLGTGTSI